MNQDGADGRPPNRHITLADIAIVITTMSIYAAYYRTEWPPVTGTIALLAGLTNVILIGAVYAGLPITLFHAIERQWPLDAGHWLWICLGLQYVASRVTITLVPLDSAAAEWFYVPWYQLILAACYLVGLMQPRIGWYWRLIFVVLLAMECLPTAYQIEALDLDLLVLLSDWFRPAVVTALMIGAVILPIRSGRPCSWLHWAGIGCCLAVANMGWVLDMIDSFIKA